MRPPGLTSGTARSSTVTCSLRRISSAPGRSRHFASGLRRHDPVPVQGASISARSIVPCQAFQLVARLFPGVRTCHIARARALKPRINRREPALVGIGRENLALVAPHGRRERERFAAGAGTQIDHLFAGLCAGEQRGELRAFILDFDQALDESGFGVNGGIFCFSFLSSMRSPSGDQRDGLAHRDLASMRRASSGVPLSVLTRRSSGARDAERRALFHPCFAEHLCQQRIEPLGIIARDIRRRFRRNRHQ